MWDQESLERDSHKGLSRRGRGSHYSVLLGRCWMGSLHSSRQSAAVLLEAAELQTEDAAAEDARMESLQKEQRAAGQHGHRAKEVREASSPTPALASIKPSSLAWEIGLPRTYLALIQPGLLKTFKHFQLQPVLSEVTNHHLMKGGAFPCSSTLCQFAPDTKRPGTSKFGRSIN